jgi:uncharacterized membrane protein YccC
MQAEPLLPVSDAIKEFISFIALFLSAGPLGFRYFALRSRDSASDRPFYDDAAKRAAAIGLIGVVIGLLMAWTGLPDLAARRHTSAGVLLTSDPPTMLQFGFLALALIGFAFAALRVSAGWALAAIGVIAGTLRLAFLGQWSRLINPVHSLAAGLWIGTLFVLVVAGLSSLFAHEPRARRGPNRRRHGEQLLAAGAVDGRRRRRVRADHRVAAPSRAVQPLVDAIRLRTHREATPCGDGVRARYVELAPPAPDARHGRRERIDPPIVDRRADRRDSRFGRDCRGCESAGAKGVSDSLSS